jgi:hypothetical protein
MSTPKAKVPLAGGAPLTASRAVVSDGSGEAESSAVTATELGYVSGVTSAIQTQIDAISSQVTPDWQPSVRAATTAALAANTYDNGTSGVGATLTGNSNGALAAQDAITLVADEELLVKDESTGANNGIYVVTQVGDGSNPYILTRRTNFDADADITAGATVFISEGTANGNETWQLTTDDDITVGTTALVFAQLTGAGGGGSITEDGSDNLFFGTGAGASITSGIRNTLGGISAGALVSEQHGNTVFGWEAGKSMTTGDGGNCLFGRQAGGSINTGAFNICIGRNAGSNITTGRGNTEINAAGTSSSIATGSNNIAIGSAVPASDLSETIGLNGKALASNQFVVGGGLNGIDDSYIGNGVISSSPAGVALNATGGSGTNIAGAALTIAGGKGTGNAAGGSIQFQVSTAGGSGSTLQTLATVGTFRSTDSSFQVTAHRNSPELHQTLTDAANIDWDMDSGASAEVVLDGARTLNSPTNINNGATYTIFVIQDATTGSRTLTWASEMKWVGGSAPTLTTAVNAVDIFKFHARGGNLYEVSRNLDVK